MAVGDEEGVFGLHDDQVVDAEQGDVGVLAGVEDDVVFRVDLGDRGVDLVVVAGSFEVFGDREPGADIVPVEGGLDVEDPAGLLHQAVVDGNGGELGELRGHGGGEVGRAAEFGDEGGELRLVADELADDILQGPDEHAGVPAEAALGEELLGEVGAGLLPEAGDFGGHLLALQAGDGGSGAAFDIAVGRAGPGGLDSDGDQAVGFFGGGQRVLHDGLEGGHVGDELIGGEHDHEGVGIPRGDESDTEGDGGRGVALGGLRENVLGRQHAGDLADRGFLLGIGQDQDVLPRDQAVEPADGLLQQGLLAEELEKLLGPGIPAEGPEAGAGAAGEDEGVGGGRGGHRWAGT